MRARPISRQRFDGFEVDADSGRLDMDLHTFRATLEAVRDEHETLRSFRLPHESDCKSRESMRGRRLGAGPRTLSLLRVPRMRHQ